jgi:large subunit ribosomal protein L23
MPEKEITDIILRPVISEKSYALIEKGRYTFIVHNDASKIQIKEAVEKVFNVRVFNVNTLNRQGKRVRNLRTGKYGKRPDLKRAIVTLQQGYKIDVFEELRG